MIRAQIVLDESTADRLRAVSEHRHASMSEVVREALVLYFAGTAPDTSWIGSLKPRKDVGHDWKDIQASVAAGRRSEAKQRRNKR
jgi:Arc/MetJ-type ribon-helix-helix transcriptional regulator